MLLDPLFYALFALPMRGGRTEVYAQVNDM